MTYGNDIKDYSPENDPIVESSIKESKDIKTTLSIHNRQK